MKVQPQPQDLAARENRRATVHADDALRLPSVSPRTARNADEKLRLVEEQCAVGHWTVDLITGLITWSNGLFRIAGLDPRTVQPTPGVLDFLVHPADKERYRVSTRHMRSGHMQDFKFRIVRPDGFCRWVRIHTERVTNAEGAPTYLFGVVVDITDSESWQSALAVETTALQMAREMIGMVVWQADIVAPDAPPCWQILLGQEIDPPPTPFSDLHEDDEPSALLQWQEARKERRSARLTFRRQTDGMQVLTNAHLVADAGGVERWVFATVDAATLHATARLDKGSPSPSRRLSPGQVRAARAILNWSAHYLSKRSGVSFSTIRRMETNGGSTPRPEAFDRLFEAFEDAGVQFHANKNGDFSVSFTGHDHFARSD